MSKEKEIQDELEKYWGQLDRVERMLKFLTVCQCLSQPLDWFEAIKKSKWTLPDISDILEEK